jgi:hypothetical protein
MSAKIFEGFFICTNAILTGANDEDMLGSFGSHLDGDYELYKLAVCRVGGGLGRGWVYRISSNDSGKNWMYEMSLSNNLHTLFKPFTAHNNPTLQAETLSPVLCRYGTPRDPVL